LPYIDTERRNLVLWPQFVFSFRYLCCLIKIRQVYCNSIALRLTLPKWTFDSCTPHIVPILVPCSRSVTRALSWIVLSRFCYWILMCLHKSISLLANTFVFIAGYWYDVITFLCIEIISLKSLDLIYYDPIFFSHFHNLYGIGFFCYWIRVGLYMSSADELHFITECAYMVQSNCYSSLYQNEYFSVLGLINYDLMNELYYSNLKIEFLNVVFHSQIENRMSEIAKYDYSNIYYRKYSSLQ
jgi:hypothetical protein